VLSRLVTSEGTTRITSKGQVTIPIEIRERLGLLPNTEVEFVLEGRTAVIRKGRRPSERGKRMLALLRGSGKVPMRNDQILALTR
jgi:AbrB family looped-hinge helix DNA binding protein